MDFFTWENLGRFWVILLGVNLFLILYEKLVGLLKNDKTL
jgi:hypothetical protein